MTTNTEAMRAALSRVTQLLKDGDTMGASLALVGVERLVDTLAQAEQRQGMPKGWESIPSSPFPWSVDGTNIVDAHGNMVARLCGTVGKYEREAINAAFIVLAVNTHPQPEEPKQPDWLAEKPNDRVYKSADDLFDALGLEKVDLPAILQRQAS